MSVSYYKFVLVWFSKCAEGGTFNVCLITLVTVAAAAEEATEAVSASSGPAVDV